MSQTSMTTIDAEPALALLSPALEGHARTYTAARRAQGEELLTMCRAVALAREEAKHGEWGIWLEAVQLGDRTARRLMAIHNRAAINPRFAEGVRSNWFNATVAGMLAERDEGDGELLDRLLAAPAPPTERQIEAIVANPAAPPDLPPGDKAAILAQLAQLTRSYTDVTDEHLVALVADSVSISEGYINKGKIRPPVEHAGALWVGVASVGAVTGEVAEAQAVRLCPAEEWPHAPLAYWDKSGSPPASFYAGIGVEWRGRSYVLTCEYLRVRSPLAAEQAATRAAEGDAPPAVPSLHAAVAEAARAALEEWNSGKPLRAGGGSPVELERLLDDEPGGSPTGGHAPAPLGGTFRHDAPSARRYDDSAYAQFSDALDLAYTAMQNEHTLEGLRALAELLAIFYAPLPERDRAIVEPALVLLDEAIERLEALGEVRK